LIPALGAAGSDPTLVEEASSYKEEDAWELVDFVGEEVLTPDIISFTNLPSGTVFLITLITRSVKASSQSL
jgi:hypothetical protein